MVQTGDPINPWTNWWTFPTCEVPPDVPDISPGVSKEEFNALKKEVHDLKKTLESVKSLKSKNRDNLLLLKNIADLLGVETKDVLK